MARLATQGSLLITTQTAHKTMEPMTKNKKTNNSNKTCTKPQAKKTSKSTTKLTKEQTLVTEKLFIEYMVAGHQSKRAMELTGLNYVVGSKEYKKFHARGVRARKKKSSTASAASALVNVDGEDAAVKYMLEGHKPKEAFAKAGINPTSGLYNRLCVRASRLRKEVEFVNKQKAKERDRRRREKILEAKFLSVQQHRHEANRALKAAETAYAEVRQLEKKKTNS